MTTEVKLKLFTPVQLGAITLGHRVVMAPLTRSRSEQPGDIPGALMAEYYGQRASEGGFIISEATNISISGRGWQGAPGLYSDAQVVGWKTIVDTVHAKGRTDVCAALAYGTLGAHGDHGRPDAGFGVGESGVLGR